MLSVGSASVSWGQTTSNQPLPPPPSPKMVTPHSSPALQTVPLSVEVSPAEDSSSSLKEYTFSAPQTLPTQTENISPSLPVNQPTGNPRFYRVEVKGQEASLLSEVKVIEPMAFIRQSEGVIHAGMFQESQQAQKRVQELQKRGVVAQVVPVYQRRNNALSVEIKR